MIVTNLPDNLLVESLDDVGCCHLPGGKKRPIGAMRLRALTANHRKVHACPLQKKTERKRLGHSALPFPAGPPVPCLRSMLSSAFNMPRPISP